MAAATEFPAAMITKVDASTVFPAKMSAMEVEFHRQQSRLVSLFRISAFSPTYWLLGLVGAVSIFVTLSQFKIPLNREILISFAVGSGVGTFLNLLIIFLHYLLSMNVRKLRKIHPSPDQKLIGKCDKLMTAVLITEGYCFVTSAVFWLYFVMLAVLATYLLPNPQDHLNFNCSTGVLHFYVTAVGSWLLFWLLLKPLSSTAVSRVSEIKI